MRNTVVTAAIVVLLTLLGTPAFAAVDGTWNFVFDTEGGERRAAITLKADGGKLTGTVEGQTEISGSVEGDKIHIEFPYYSEEAGLKAVVKIDGKVSGNKISGTWEFDIYSGTFEATKSE